jgi:NADH:ubiquinone oxidoreductase subunit K
MLFDRLDAYLWISLVLFCIGLFGLLTRRNAIAILMSVELLLNAVCINLVAFSRFVRPVAWGWSELAPAQPAYYDVTGQVFAIIVITLAAAEVAVGLAIVVAVFRQKQTANLDQINLLKW